MREEAQVSEDNVDKQWIPYQTRQLFSADRQNPAQQSLVSD